MRAMSPVPVAWLSQRMMMPSVIRKISLPPKMTMKAITKLLFVLKKSVGVTLLCITEAKNR